MNPELKKLGEMLVDAGLLLPAHLQEALRYQRINGGRMGSNLVALGMISEDTLMDFLSQQTGVPRVDLRNLDIPTPVLERIPRRLAEQMNILPVSFKEPKSLVLAMADPSDLNAVDSARFSSGLNIEPMVATHTSLRQAIATQYRKLEAITGRTDNRGTVDIGEALPVPLDLAPRPLEVLPMSQPPAAPPVAAPTSASAAASRQYGRDPFFDDNTGLPSNPLALLGQDDFPLPGLTQGLTSPAPPPPPVNPPLPAGIVHDRGSQVPRSRSIESFRTRTLILGLIRLLQRRGVVTEDELVRTIQNLLETRQIREDETF